MLDLSSSWRILLNECRGKKKKTRLIFTNFNCRYIVDITIDTSKADKVIQAVLSANWNCDELMTYLHAESEQVLVEML